MCRSLPGRRAWLAAALAAWALAPAGCNHGTTLSPVRGTVTLEDGSPLKKGMVIFEGTAADGKAVTARGEVRPDGSYELGTFKPGDGAPVGKYRVQINPMDLSEVPDEEKKLPFDAKYLKFETSGLEYEVRPGPNAFSLRLTAPAPAEEKPADKADKPAPKGDKP
jgi:hypothetical protein